MTDTLELELAIKKAGLTKRELAQKLGLSEMGFYKKINNITEFKASELEALIRILHIEDVGKIFFSNKVDLKSTNS